MKTEVRVDVKSLLLEIGDSNGGVIHPEDVVDAARPDTSPLHPHFEWDDSVAAEKHRVWQARQLIRNVHVTVETPDGPTRVRALLNVVDDDGRQGYRAAEEVLSTPVLRDQFLARIRSDVRLLVERLRRYEDPATLRFLSEANLWLDVMSGDDA